MDSKVLGKDKVAQFEMFFKSVRTYDSAIHSLNDEFEAVNIIGSKPKIDRRRAEEALKTIQPAFENMRVLGSQLLTALS